MRRRIPILAVSAVLWGCAKAGAAAPDSHNPVHCISAITYEMVLWDRVGNHQEQVKEGIVRVMFEDGKLKAQGRTHEDAKPEVLAFMKAYDKDPATMHRLAAGCLAEENSDPSFPAEKRRIIAFMSGDPL